MTVQELINKLNTIEDKSKTIGYNLINLETKEKEFVTIDHTIGINEYTDIVELQYDITDIVRNALNAPKRKSRDMKPVQVFDCKVEYIGELPKRPRID